jgi:hypothetical protein
VARGARVGSRDALEMNPQSIRQLFAPGARRTTLRVLIAAVLVAAICWYLGADVWNSVVLGCVTATVGSIGLIGVAFDISDIDWRGAGRDRTGSRKDVAQLSGSLRGGLGRVDNGAIWRMRQIARPRLARHGLDYRNPAHRREIEQLIGRRPYAVLLRGERRRPLLGSFLSCLDALDALNALEPTDSPGPAPRSSRRIPPFSKPRSRRAREL